MAILMAGEAVLLALVVLGALVLGSYHVIFRRPLPRTVGEIEVEGLAAAIEIRRDRWGVPHILSRDRQDGAFGVGFTHAQDRLWQMELQRRIAAGRLSEVIGERGLPIDRLMRRLGLRRVSEAEWHVTHAAGELRGLLEAYARGVNAAMLERPLAAEFTILRHRPEPWQPEDSLAVGRLLSFIQAGNWEAQLIRVRILKELGPELTAALDPAYPEGHPRVGAAGPAGSLHQGDPPGWASRRSADAAALLHPARVRAPCADRAFDVRALPFHPGARHLGAVMNEKPIEKEGPGAAVTAPVREVEIGDLDGHVGHTLEPDWKRLPIGPDHILYPAWRCFRF